MGGGGSHYLIQVEHDNCYPFMQRLSEWFKELKELGYLEGFTVPSASSILNGSGHR